MSWRVSSPTVVVHELRFPPRAFSIFSVEHGLGTRDVRVYLVTTEGKVVFPRYLSVRGPNKIRVGGDAEISRVIVEAGDRRYLCDV